MNDGFMDSLIEQNPDAIIFADTERAIRVWNVTAERVFGFTKGEFVPNILWRQNSCHGCYRPPNLEWRYLNLLS